MNLLVTDMLPYELSYRPVQSVVGHTNNGEKYWQPQCDIWLPNVHYEAQKIQTNVIQIGTL